MTAARTCLALALLASCAPPKTLEPSIEAKEIDPRPRAANTAQSPAPSARTPPAASRPPCFRAVVERCYESVAEACEVAGCADACHPAEAGASVVVDCAGDRVFPLASFEVGCVRIAEAQCHADREAACSAVQCPIDVHRYCAELEREGDTVFVHCAHGGW